MLERKDNPLLFWAGEQFFGAAPIAVKSLIERVRALPGLGDWAPSGQTMEVNRLLILGMVLKRIDDASFTPILERISKSLKEDGAVPRDDVAELIAAGIVRPWSDRVTHIPRVQGARSPDLVANESSGDTEIEVTTASRKHEQVERNNVASNLQTKLREIPLDRHIDVHFLDTLSSEEEKAIVEVASKLEIGYSAEVKDRWHVNVSGPSMGAVAVAGNANPPAWFPKQPATPASFSTMVTIGAPEGQSTMKASAQARWGLSTKAYLNPLSKKADRPQGSNKAPFVIALDTTQMPGADGWYAEALAGYWDLWPHVSAVLLFFGPAWAGNVFTLWYKLLVNPVSTFKVPKAWSGGKWEEQLY